MISSQKRFHFDNRDMQKQLGPYWLYQMGDLNCVGDYHIERHRQFVYEVTYVAVGMGHIWVDDREYIGKAGNVFINRIGDIHELYGDRSGEFRYFYLGFDFKDVSDPAIRRIRELFDDPKNVMAESAPGVQEAFLRLFSEAIRQDRFSELLVESYISDLLVHIHRAFDRQRYVVYQAEEGGSEKLVYDLINYIDLNVGRFSRLTELCAVFGYSYSHLAKQFTRVMGESLQSYFMRRRFRMAEEHLCEGMSVTEVAERMGYQSVHAFSRAFHKQVGMAPSAYRELAENGRQEL